MHVILACIGLWLFMVMQTSGAWSQPTRNIFMLVNAAWAMTILLLYIDYWRQRC